MGWGGDLLTFLVGRLTLLMLIRRSWVGLGWGSVNVLVIRTSYVVDVGSTVLGWGGDLLTFLVGRLTLLMLGRRSWVGVGWGSVNVLGRTSYVVDVGSTVLGWGGVGIC